MTCLQVHFMSHLLQAHVMYQNPTCTEYLMTLARIYDHIAWRLVLSESFKIVLQKLVTFLSQVYSCNKAMSQ